MRGGADPHRPDVVVEDLLSSCRFERGRWSLTVKSRETCLRIGKPQRSRRVLAKVLRSPAVRSPELSATLVADVNSFVGCHPESTGAVLDRVVPSALGQTEPAAYTVPAAFSILIDTARSPSPDRLVLIIEEELDASFADSLRGAEAFELSIADATDTA